MRREQRLRGVQTIDLLGPLLHRMERLLGVMPQLHPGLLSAIDRRSLRLAESIDFTLQHDERPGGGKSGSGRCDHRGGVAHLKDPHQPVSFL